MNLRAFIRYCGYTANCRVMRLLRVKTVVLLPCSPALESFFLFFFRSFFFYKSKKGLKDISPCLLKAALLWCKNVTAQTSFMEDCGSVVALHFRVLVSPLFTATLSQSMSDSNEQQQLQAYCKQFQIHFPLEFFKKGETNSAACIICLELPNSFVSLKIVDT